MSFSIYFDEDSQDMELVRILRARGLLVSTVNEENRRSKTDEEQVSFAALKERTIFSYNVADFCRIHARWMAEGKEHFGIIVANQQHFHLGELANRIVHIHGSLSSEEMKNRLEYLSNW